MISFFVEQASLGGLGDSFYEYLLKSWVLSGKKDETARKMYEGAMKVTNPRFIRFGIFLNCSHRQQKNQCYGKLQQLI